MAQVVLPLTEPLLVIDQDEFVLNYVASALTAGGAQRVLTASSSREGARHLADTPNIAAAAISVTLAEDHPWQLASDLLGRGIPCVFLAKAGDVALPTHLSCHPILVQPFAGFQVGELIMRSLATS